MIKIYKIKVADKIYEVEVESITEKEGTIETPIISTGTTVKKDDNVKGIEIEAPIQGVVISVNVKEGQTVKKGQTLVMLEAMKMENPVIAPNDGIISKIYVSNGQKIDSGMVMIILS